MTVFESDKNKSEKEYVRDLIKKYVEYASSPQMNERRRLWSEHHSMNFSRPLIYIRAIPFGEFFDSTSLKCTDPYLRSMENSLKFKEYHSRVRDDFIEEAYFTVRADVKCAPYVWGMPCGLGKKTINGGAAAFNPSIIEEEDIEKLYTFPHEINEESTSLKYEKLAELVDNIAPVYVDRQGILCDMWQSDISTSIAKLRGLEQIMWDVYDRPEWLHKLLAFMRDKIIQNMDETEKAGDFSYLNHQNQAMPYINELTPPCGERTSQNKLWGYMAAQEYTGFSADMFREFLFDYQKPILERYAYTAYGCCENLTDKIEVITTLKNLRRIAVSPFSDLKKCAEQIGNRYILSWRPNPSDMVSCGVDEEYVRKYIRNGIDIMKQNGCKYDITLKDVETVSGDENAIIRWTDIVRDEIDKIYS